MKFMMTFALKPATRNDAIARFLKTGGQPPKGVKLLGRWCRADFSGGFDLLETDDPQTLADFSLMWSDLLELTVVPVLDDEQIVKVLTRMKK